VELFAIYLHKLRLLQISGDMFNHRIFKNKSLIDKKIPPEFPDRNKVLELMREIETERNAICYGTRKPKQRIEKAIQKFQELRKLINLNLNKQKSQNGKK